MPLRPLRLVVWYAESQGWNLRLDHVYTGAAVSGAAPERPGFQALLADAVRILQQLKFFGVRVL